MLAVPNQTPGALRRYGLSRADGDRQVWAIDAGGRRYRGAAAVNKALAALGGGWRLPGLLARNRFLYRLEARAYRWVAAHRSWLGFWSTRPECDEPQSGCE